MRNLEPLRRRLETIVFGTDTRAGRAFDMALIYIILASVLAVVLESVHSLHMGFIQGFFILEWFFTIVFTIEYLLRIWILKKPLKYIFSWLGIIDLLSILPTYLELFFSGTHFLMSIRILRLLRIFRILKLTHYIRQSNYILAALRNSRSKIFVFLFGIFHLVLILGSVMYVVEGGNYGFDSIPRSIYWAIVTITTVGYGDISPHTGLGQFIASIMMLIGYSIIAVPTGIVTMEMSRVKAGRHCDSCHEFFTEPEAKYCPKCGAKQKEE